MLKHIEEYKAFIKNRLDRRTLLELLGEECAELIQAANKCIRAEKLNANATPMSEQEANAQLREEVGDVLMLLSVLGYDCDFKTIATNPKWERWCKRLEAVEKRPDYRAFEHAAWVDVGDKDFMCSACGLILGGAYCYGWCPHCGARMDLNDGLDTPHS